MDIQTLYWVPFFVAAMMIFTVAVSVFPRRRVRGGGALILLSLSAAWWATTEGLLYFGFSLETNLLLTKLQYLGSATNATLALIFLLDLYGPHRYLTARNLSLAALIPGAIILLAWTNESHRLLWPRWWVIEGGPTPMLGLAHGPVFVFFMIYSYLAVAGGMIILVRQALTSANLYRSQALVLLPALALTWAASLVYVGGWSPIANMDPGSLGYAAVTGAMAWAFSRYHFLDVVPVAKSEVFRSLSEAIVVVDGQGRIVDVNPAGEAVLGLDRLTVVGREVINALVTEPSLEAVLADPSRDHAEVTLGRTREPLTYDLRLSSLKDRRGRSLGRLLVFRDISDRKQLEVELHRLATTDPLTGARNRRSFFDLGEAELVRSKRYGHALALLLLDVDHFKAFNDAHGHLAGDEALKALVACCQNGLRQNDLLGRLGGEEFAILVVETDPAKALAVAERLRVKAAEMTIPTTAGMARFTISVGVASRTDQDQSLADLLGRADAALYQAKAAGRDRVVQAEARPSSPN